MEDGQKARVDVTVLDRGTSQASGYGPLGCSEPSGAGAYRVLPHVWSPVTIDGSGSTWFCSRCRRIERRTLVESG